MDLKNILLMNYQVITATRIAHWDTYNTNGVIHEVLWETYKYLLDWQDKIWQYITREWKYIKELKSDYKLDTNDRNEIWKEIIDLIDEYIHQLVDLYDWLDNKMQQNWFITYADDLKDFATKIKSCLD